VEGFSDIFYESEEQKWISIVAATTIGRTDTALGAFYRRLAARAGKAKAVTATARKLLINFFARAVFWSGWHHPPHRLIIFVM